LRWHIGDRIGREVPQEKRAGHGEEIISALGRQLDAEFGRGLTEKSLRRMIQFAKVFPDQQIVATLRVASPANVTVPGGPLSGVRKVQASQAP
jgi:hypothetical protein